jgi:hypothetical protein
MDRHAPRREREAIVDCRRNIGATFYQHPTISEYTAPGRRNSITEILDIITVNIASI